MKSRLSGVRPSGAAVYFAAAFVLALLAGLGVYSFLRSAVPTQKVYVVTRDIPPGTRITPADLAEREVPDGAAPPGAIRQASDVTDKRLRYGLVAGDIVREHHLVEEANSEVAQQVSAMGDAYRAVMIPADLVPADTQLVPGDRLELLGVLPLRTETENTTVAMPVGLATVLEQPKGEAGKGMVLVALKDADVARMALAMQSGTLVVAVQGSEPPESFIPSMRLEELTSSPPEMPERPAQAVGAEPAPPAQPSESGGR